MVVSMLYLHTFSAISTPLDSLFSNLAAFIVDIVVLVVVVVILLRHVLDCSSISHNVFLHRFKRHSELLSLPTTNPCEVHGSNRLQ